MEKKRRKIEKRRWKIENGRRKSYKMRKGCFFLLFFFFFFFFFFAFHFSKPVKFVPVVLGVQKWEFSTGKKHYFTPGKKTLPL